MTATESHQRRPLVLLRPVPGPSAIHDLWAGTKLITALAISVLLASYPGWGPIALTAALLITTARLAHIPRGALPSVPRWLWITTLLTGATAALAGGSPFVDVGPFTVGLGGLLDVLRFALLTGVLLGLGGMVSWTTNVLIFRNIVNVSFAKRFKNNYSAISQIFVKGFVIKRFNVCWKVCIN